jgi:hypothetical protein
VLHIPTTSILLVATKLRLTDLFCQTDRWGSGTRDQITALLREERWNYVNVNGSGCPTSWLGTQRLAGSYAASVCITVCSERCCDVSEIYSFGGASRREGFTRSEGNSCWIDATCLVWYWGLRHLLRFWNVSDLRSDCFPVVEEQTYFYRLQRLIIVFKKVRPYILRESNELESIPFTHYCSTYNFSIILQSTLLSTERSLPLKFT